jgi:hypothetical protein
LFSGGLRLGGNDPRFDRYQKAIKAKCVCNDWPIKWLKQKFKQAARPVLMRLIDDSLVKLDVLEQATIAAKDNASRRVPAARSSRDKSSKYEQQGSWLWHRRIVNAENRRRDSLKIQSIRPDFPRMKPDIRELKRNRSSADSEIDTPRDGTLSNRIEIDGGLR